MNDFYLKQECRLCESKELGNILSLTDSPLCDAYLKEKKEQKFYPLKLNQCSDCGFVQINCVVNPEIIYRDYIYVTTSSSGLKNHFKSYTDNVFAYLKPTPQCLVVDIGSNDGTMLDYFQQKKIRTLGIEPSVKTAKDATKRGIETLPEFFSLELSKKIVEKYGKANLITINNLFANIDSLNDFVNGLENLLAEEGILIIESSYLLDMVNNMVFDFVYHEHLSYFSIIPLVRFFGKYRIKLIRIEHVETKGGSLRYYWAKENSNRHVDGSVSQFISKEKNAGINKNFFMQFKTRIDQLKKELLEALDNNKNLKIFGYGASATSTTLISHFGLNDYISTLIDDNPGKIGTHSPGYHIPVKGFDSLLRDPPDVIIILAWRYHKEIFQKISSLNCKIIVPLPKLTFID